jgi:Cullin protein neddylation domain
MRASARTSRHAPRPQTVCDARRSRVMRMVSSCGDGASLSSPPAVQVLQDRQHQMDAALVRTMKARRQISHQLLIGEVLPQLRFNVRAADLKKRIEGLIEREYMARHAQDYELYNYVA